jgi:hypothetical protein
MFQLFIDGEGAEDRDAERVFEPQCDGESLRVALEDVNRSIGFDEACRHCGEPIEERSDGWHHVDGELMFCRDSDEDDPRMAEPGPWSWCNSAAITLDAEDDAVHVSISVGDPRGAFVFTVRRVPAVFNGDGSVANPDLAGRLLLHMPYPGEGLPHMETVELRPGTLQVVR